MIATHKPMPPLFILLFIAAVIIIFYSIYDAAFTKSGKQSLAIPSIKTDAQLLVNKKQLSDRQLTIDVNAEIIFLKAEIKRINSKLSQLTSHAGNVTPEMLFTAEEIRGIEATNDEYEITNELNRVNSANQIEDYFVEQAENATEDTKQENTIIQSLAIGQNDKASIVDLQCKSSLCRVELKYDLTALDTDEATTGEDNTGFSTNISSLLDAAVSKEINEIDQSGVAVIFLGQLDTNLAIDPL